MNSHKKFPLNFDRFKVHNLQGRNFFRKIRSNAVAMCEYHLSNVFSHKYIAK